MRSALNTEDPKKASFLGTEGLEPDSNVDILFSHYRSSADNVDLHPHPLQSFRLWQIFLDRVNPVIKIVHIPTLQSHFMEMTANHVNVALNYQALFFAIYLMASISLLDHESYHLLGMSREQAVQKFGLGLKQSLIGANFLRDYNMVTLQALTFFLVRVTLCNTQTCPH